MCWINEVQLLITCSHYLYLIGSIYSPLVYETVINAKQMELKNNHNRKDNIEAGNSIKTLSMAEGLGLVWHAGNQETPKEGIPSGEYRLQGTFQFSAH